MSASDARKWIELNWLRRGHKEIQLPDIIFEKEKFGGCHWPRQRNEIEINGRFYSLEDRGLIVINSRYDNDDGWILNCIAHEWRHVYQQHNSRAILHSTFPLDGDYDKNILWYFNIYPHEMDALLFSIKKAPDNASIYWFDLLRDHNE